MDKRDVLPNMVKKLIDIPEDILAKIKTKAKYLRMPVKRYIEMLIDKDSEQPTTYRYISERTAKRRKKAEVIRLKKTRLSRAMRREKRFFLVIKNELFDSIVNEVQNEVYVPMDDFYSPRLIKDDQIVFIDKVILKRGNGKKKIYFGKNEVRIGLPNPKWVDNEMVGKEVFCITLGRRMGKRYRPLKK